MNCQPSSASTAIANPVITAKVTSRYPTAASPHRTTSKAGITATVRGKATLTVPITLRR